MMGTRSSSGSGTDALAGLLALVNDPKAAAARLEELKAEMAKVDEARALLHADQYAFQLEKTERDGLVRDLERRELELSAKVAEHATAVVKLEADTAAMVKRAGEFEERDRVRDAKAAAERQAIREERAALEGERTATAAAAAELTAERSALEERATLLEQAHEGVNAEAARLATTFAALAAIINGDDADAASR